MAALDTSPFEDLLASHSVFVSPLPGAARAHSDVDRYGQRVEDHYADSERSSVRDGTETHDVNAGAQRSWAGPSGPPVQDDARARGLKEVDAARPDDVLNQHYRHEGRRRQQQNGASNMPPADSSRNDASDTWEEPAYQDWNSHGDEHGQKGYVGDGDKFDTTGHWDADHPSGDPSQASVKLADCSVQGDEPIDVPDSSPDLSRSFEDQPIRGLAAGGKGMSLDDLIAQGERQMQEAQAKTVRAKAPSRGFSAGTPDDPSLRRPRATPADVTVEAPAAGTADRPGSAQLTGDGGACGDGFEAPRRDALLRSDADSAHESSGIMALRSSALLVAGGGGTEARGSGGTGGLRHSASIRSASFATSWSGEDAEQLRRISMGVTPAGGGGDSAALQEAESREEQERREFYELEMELLREEERDEQDQRMSMHSETNGHATERAEAEADDDDSFWEDGRESWERNKGDGGTRREDTDKRLALEPAQTTGERFGWGGPGNGIRTAMADRHHEAYREDNSPEERTRVDATPARPGLWTDNQEQDGVTLPHDAHGPRRGRNEGDGRSGSGVDAGERPATDYSQWKGEGELLVEPHTRHTHEESRVLELAGRNWWDNHERGLRDVSLEGPERALDIRRHDGQQQQGSSGSTYAAEQRPAARDQLTAGALPGAVPDSEGARLPSAGNGSPSDDEFGDDHVWGEAAISTGGGAAASVVAGSTSSRGGSEAGGPAASGTRGREALQQQRRRAGSTEVPAPAMLQGTPPQSELVQRVFGARGTRGRGGGRGRGRSGRGLGRTGDGGRYEGDESAHNASWQVQANLQGKIQELDEEITRYKEENECARSARRKQETALAEVMRKRQEVRAWAEAERAAVEAWCAEQKQAIAREKRSVMKQVQGLRARAQAGGASGAGTAAERRQRQEMEGLKATIERAKLDAEAARKKSRASERRLQQQIKAGAERVAELEGQVSFLERQRVDLWASSAGVALGGSRTPTGDARSRISTDRSKGASRKPALGRPGRAKPDAGGSAGGGYDGRSQSGEAAQQQQLQHRGRAVFTPVKRGTHSEDNRSDMHQGSAAIGARHAAGAWKEHGEAGPGASDVHYGARQRPQSQMQGDHRRADAPGWSGDFPRVGDDVSASRAAGGAVERPDDSARRWHGETGSDKHDGGQRGERGQGGRDGSHSGDGWAAEEGQLSSSAARWDPYDDERRHASPQTAAHLSATSSAPDDAARRRPGGGSGGGGGGGALVVEDAVGQQTSPSYPVTLGQENDRRPRDGLGSAASGRRRANGWYPYDGSARQNSDAVMYDPLRYKSADAPLQGAAADNAVAVAVDIGAHRSSDARSGRDTRAPLSRTPAHVLRSGSGRQGEAHTGSDHLSGRPDRARSGGDGLTAPTPAAAPNTERSRAQAAQDPEEGVYGRQDGTRRSQGLAVHHKWNWSDGQAPTGGDKQFHNRKPSTRAEVFSASGGDSGPRRPQQQQQQGQSEIGRISSKDREPFSEDSTSATAATEDVALEKAANGSAQPAAPAASMESGRQRHGSGKGSTATGTGKVEHVLPDGRRIVLFANGTQKEILADGGCVVRFMNGDLKRVEGETGVVIYTYAHAQTTHTMHPSGLEVFEFPNGQVERHHKSGEKEIDFPDGTRKTILPNGQELSEFPDGVTVVEYPEGYRDVTSPDGTTHRELADGSVQDLRESPEWACALPSRGEPMPPAASSSSSSLFPRARSSSRGGGHAFAADTGRQDDRHGSRVTATLARDRLR